MGGAGFRTLWLGGPWRSAALGVSFGFLFLAVLVSPGMAAQALCLSPGSGAGQCSNPQGVATDFETERVYVADRGNHRISVFEADGDFLFAFGWGVNPITPGSGLETCTTASGCQQGISGAGAGQLSSPEWIAVDNVAGSAALHDVYVTDANRRVSHFKEDGSFVNAFGWGVDTGAEAAEVCTTASGCLIGIQGGGECQLGGIFLPVAVGPAGNVFVAATAEDEPDRIGRVQKFSPEGACLGETVLGSFRLITLAVDASEDAYVSAEGVGAGAGALRKYDLATAETLLCQFDPSGVPVSALAMDEAGHLFAAQRERGSNGSNLFQVITEYDVSSCSPTAHVRRFGYGEIDTNVEVAGIAALHTADGDVFVSEGGASPVNYLKVPPPGPITPTESLEVIRRASANADVRAEVNPEGKATSYHFEYVDEAQFEINGFTEAESTPTEPLDISVGREFRVNGVETTVLGCEEVSKAEIDAGNCLTPETTYRWRIVSSNADGPGLGTAEGPPFETKAPLEFEDLWASEVGPDTAVLSAIVNPVGSSTTGFFEYVTDAQFKASGFDEAVKVPNPPGEAELDFGEGEEGVKRSATLFPLLPGTTYHYRIAATNPLVEEFLGVEFLFSEAETFETFAPPGVDPCPANEAFRIGPSSLLPDCRAYEMVSPLDKANGDIIVLPEGVSILPAVVNQSAASGERLTYGSVRPFGKVKSAPYTSQYIAARDPEVGWETHAINPPKGRSIAGQISFDLDNEYRAFSEDLCEGWITTFAEPPADLAEEDIPGYRNLYRRTDELCGEEIWEAITTAKPNNLPLPQNDPKNPVYRVELQGTSADGSVAAFIASDSLQGSGASLQPGDCGSKGNCRLRLYVKGEGAGAKPRFACVLPGGALIATNDNCAAGTLNESRIGSGRSANVSGALSEDGARIFWTTWSSGEGEGKIFLRENPLGAGGECSGPAAPCTVAVSKGGEEESGSSGAHFWAGAKDGSAALYTTGSILTGKDLYRYVTATKATEQIAGGVLGLVGASADAKRVYFASTEVLTGTEENEVGQKAEAGKANLYFHEAGGSYRFLGQLAASDLLIPGRFPTSPIAIEPVRHNGRVSPSGLHAAFMSAASLTGYDNTDAKSGKADTEVFLYDAAANGGAGELLCASCNPSGGRPAGADVAGLDSDWWVAARIPGAYSILRTPEVLSPEGSRLFFESIDPLVARDTNGRVDVYQWERAGQGGCDEADAGFSEAAGGCIDLISTGQSLADSLIVDASASGADVFFTTVEGILPQDYGLQDVYDARIEGGFPPPPPKPVDCEGESCQNPPGAPEFPTGASETSVGPGNMAAKKPKGCPKGKHKAKKAGKSRCVANKKKGKGQRAAQQRRASR